MPEQQQQTDHPRHTELLAKNDDQVAPPAPPIKSTKTRRFLTIAATWLAVRTGHSFGFIGARISPKLMVKRGPGVRLEEAHNLEFVRENSCTSGPSIPVPKVHCAFTTRQGCTYIVMDYIRGQTLGQWWQVATTEAREDVLRQLRGHMNILRGILHPTPTTPGQISGLKGSGPIYDYRLTESKGSGPRPKEGFGPFPDTHAFHLWLRNGFTGHEESSEKSDQDVDIKRMCQIQDRRSYPSTNLTHGDLSSSNIIIKNNKVVGLLDWEMAGWYPDYWEFTSAWHVNVYDEFWRSEVGKLLDGDKYEAELEAEKIRRRYFQAP